MFRNLIFRTLNKLNAIGSCILNLRDIFDDMLEIEEPDKHDLDHATERSVVSILAMSADIALSLREVTNIAQSPNRGVSLTLPERCRGQMLVIPSKIVNMANPVRSMQRIDYILNAYEEGGLSRAAKVYVDELKQPPMVALSPNGEAPEALMELADGLLESRSASVLVNLSPGLIGWALIIAHIKSCSEMSEHQSSRLVMAQHRPRHTFFVYDAICDLVAGKLDREAQSVIYMNATLGSC